MESQYEFLEKIGGGAFGEVHLARHVLTGGRFAVKRLRVNDDGRLAVLPAAQFQEIEALRQLEHPNVGRRCHPTGFPDLLLTPSCARS